MPLTRSRLALLVALCLCSTAALADNTPAPATAAPAAAAATAPATSTMISMAQADAIILQNGFTPVGQPKLKGTVIGSLARLGDKAFIVTVDAMTGKFLDAKPTDIALPPLAATAPAPAPAAPAVAAAPAPAAPAQMAPPAANAQSPVMRAANLARSKGFKVLSFRHVNDDTFIVGQRGGQLFNLKISDKGQILATTPARRANDHDTDSD